MGRLLQLEVENFKSYKGRQIIGPFNNFTSVIGPNGSGKSNLMDAISFVLGVKSSDLRSSQLKELIYRGGRAEQSEDADEAEDTRPTRAYVMALYRTSDDKELKFMRSITPSGASEYKMNNKVVTFQQYTKALEKENILVKARNFLVFQGDVETVASQSPKDLTRLIEQISGSLELKAEYERLRDLQDRAAENSAHNFNKKRGITAEMKQFKEQKEEAERFEALQAERDEVILKHLLWKLYHIDKNVGLIEKEIEEEKGNSEQYEEQMAELEGRLKDAKKQHAKVNKEFMRHEKKLKEKEKAREERKPDLMKLEEKIKHSSKKLGAAEENLTKARKQYERHSKLVKEMEKDLSRLTKASQKYEEEVKRRASEKGPVLTEEDMAEYNSKKEEVSSKTFVESQELKNMQRQQVTDAATKGRLEEQLKGIQSRESVLLDEQNTLEERKAKFESTVQQLSAELDQAKHDLNAAEAERRRINQTETELKEKLEETQQKLLSARVDKRESEREETFKANLEQLKSLFNGVYGRMIDLCKPTQRKYDLAVSIILGRNIDAVVVDTEKTAIECINHLRMRRAGQATFIPLDTIVARPVNEKYRSFAKGARLAIDVIQYDAAYERALQYACGNALVCDTMDVARHVCFERGQEVKAVTLDGMVIHKTGMMTGGDAGSMQRGARRWEEKEVEGLKKVRDNILSELDEVVRARRRGGPEEQLRGEIRNLEGKLRVAKEDLVGRALFCWQDNVPLMILLARQTATVHKLDACNKELAHIKEESAKVTPELAKVTRSLEGLEERMQETDAGIREVEDSVFAEFCRRIGVSDIREYEQRQLKFSEETAQRRLEFATQIAKIENQLSFERQQAKDVSDRVTKIETAIRSDKDTLAALEEEKEAQERADAQLEEEITLARSGLDGAKEDLDEKQAAVAKVKKEISKLNKEIEGKSKIILAKQSQIEKYSGEKFSIFRKCKLEEIELPLLGDASLEDLSLEEIERAQLGDTDSMDVDSGSQSMSQSQSQSRAKLKSIEVDYSSLKKAERTNGSDETEAEFVEKIKSLSSEIEKMAPNMRAVDRLDEVEAKLKDTASEFEAARKDAKNAKDKFDAIKQQRSVSLEHVDSLALRESLISSDYFDRYEKFYDAFRHISDRIDHIYKDLTRSRNFPLGGTAQLNLEDSDEPFNGGVKYHAMPPMKRFQEMEVLSGGEKTVAALALLFAIHSYQPAPFFVLDEVDAALDNANVAKVANYIRNHASDQFQFIVISLKSTFYETAEALVGIYRDQDLGSSRCLTLQLEGKFEE
ncbi:Structural maintenance of chromosomes protein 1 [Borealophlyctis nickersoniae]|nr:Structural maintenance of chromosomes protein 1 [Borealophlyctis nickersoniae]